MLLVYPAIGRLVLWDVLLDAAEHGEHQAVAQRTVVQVREGARCGVHAACPRARHALPIAAVALAAPRLAGLPL